MNPRQLRYCLRIAGLRSFTRAATVLHVAQPSLSRQIQLLEHEPECCWSCAAALVAESIVRRHLAKGARSAARWH
jgi:hypothetical protein